MALMIHWNCLFSEAGSYAEAVQCSILAEHSHTGEMQNTTQNAKTPRSMAVSTPNLSVDGLEGVNAWRVATIDRID